MRKTVPFCKFHIKSHYSTNICFQVNQTPYLSARTLKVIISINELPDMSREKLDFENEKCELMLNYVSWCAISMNVGLDKSNTLGYDASI